eukprot:jgi/Ulvmu1/2515/UM138_0019.1
MAQSALSLTIKPSYHRSRCSQSWLGGSRASFNNSTQQRRGSVRAHQRSSDGDSAQEQRSQEGHAPPPKPRYIPEWNSIDIAEGEALETALADAQTPAQPPPSSVSSIWQVPDDLHSEARQLASEFEPTTANNSRFTPSWPQGSVQPARPQSTPQPTSAQDSPFQTSSNNQPQQNTPFSPPTPQPSSQQQPSATSPPPVPSTSQPPTPSSPTHPPRPTPSPTPPSTTAETPFPALGVNPRPPSSSSGSPFFPSLSRSTAGLPSSASLDFSTPVQPPPESPPPTPRRTSTASSAAATTGSGATSATARYRSLASSSGKDRPAYRPRSALSLARRRMIAKYLPFSWQRQLRRRAEGIPEQQFNYLLSTLVIIGTAAAAGCAAYALWPYARTVINYIFSADAVEARVLQELTFETQYLAAISLVTAILFGNTFAFSFDRQRQIIQEIAEEIFALELLLQELFIEIPEPHLRWRVIKHIKRYVDDEIQARDIDSPFRVDGAIMGLFDALLTLREEGKSISKLLLSVEMLAQANSRRGALAAALLPPLHWVMLGSLCALLLSAFVLFDSDFSNPVAENRAIFAVLSAMLVTILQVLRDISTPDDGLYSVRDPMETRLSYVRWQMDNILSDPTIKVSMLNKEDTEAATDSEGEDDDSITQPLWMKDRS